jgi:hypothetical protein
MYVRLLLFGCSAVCLMLGPVGAQQRSTNLFDRRVVQNREADPEARNQINEAFRAFEELLEVTRRAAAMNSHWRVREASWHEAQEAWEKSSAVFPVPVRRLKRCAVSLSAARGLIERADSLFLQARDSSDPVKAVQLLDQHKKLMKQSIISLKQAERCYRAVRNGYLKTRKLNNGLRVEISAS